MTRTSPATVAYDPANPRRNAATVVQAQLDQLGLGEHWVQTREQEGRPVFDRRIPPGHGWCRALNLCQALWPASADLCVEVEWHSDLDVPSDEQDEHWETRLDVVRAGLQSLGYTVRTPGPRRTPGVDRYQPMIVSRLPVGASLAPSPADGWDHLPVHPAYARHVDDPISRLRRTLEDSCLESYGARALDTHLWPPYATGAWVVMWHGALTTNVAEWDSAMARVRRVLRISGYGFLDHRRPWDPAVDQVPYLIAYLREELR
ncbi:hypothetical protein ABTY96_46380 [Streptomyces sp. NPDC096057]|uniref:hypothetical protein n=1 Tax=Streptomyces sp. NPDC096057 TaxID=3155543 RepID=UPI00332597F2